MQLAAPQAALLVADRFNDHQLFEADVTACGCAPAWGQTSFNDHQLFEADVTASYHREESILPVSMTISCLKLM